VVDLLLSVLKALGSIPALNRAMVKIGGSSQHSVTPYSIITGDLIFYKSIEQ
jgi:hypothetical protein